MVLQRLLLQLLPLLLEIPQFFLLQHIGEFLPYKLQLLLIEYIDMLIDVIVEPGVIEHLVGGGSLLRDFLKHHFHNFDRFF